MRRSSPISVCIRWICVAASASSALGVDPHDPAGLAALHAEHLDALGCARVVDTIDKHWPWEGGREAAWLVERAASAAAWTAFFEQEAARRGWSPERMQHALSQALQQDAQLTSLQTVHSENARILVRRTRTMDFSTSNLRWDDVDLRDLGAISAERGLNEMQSANLDQSTSKLLSPSGSY